MPRPKSGNPPWRALAVKLPPDEIADVQRYSDLHRVSISDLLREGLRLRIAPTAMPPATHPSLAQRLVPLLTQVIAELQRGTQESTEAQWSNGYTSTESYGYTVTPQQQLVTTPMPSDDITVIPQQETEPGSPRAARRPVGSSYGRVTDQVLEALRTHHPATPAALAKGLGLEPVSGTKAVHQSLQRLVKRGLVRKDGKGYQAV